MSTSHLEQLLESGGDTTAGQVFRYLAVGGLGYLLAMASFGVATAVGAPPYPTVAAVFILNGIFNFVLFRRWTFPQSHRTLGSEARRFIAVALLTLTLNYGIFAILYSVLGLAAFPAQALAVVGATPLSFVANRAWSFQSAGPSPAPLEMLR